MATLTANPSNTLSIKIQRVNKAYFAKKEVLSTEKSGETFAYTFKGSNNTSTKERKEKIAGIIFKNISPKIESSQQQTTLEQVVNTLTKSAYVGGDCIDIPLLKEKIKFTKLPNANIGDTLYIVVETENMPEREIKMNLKQGGEDKVLKEVGKSIFVTQNQESGTLFTAIVGEFTNKDTVANASDFTDYAISKITLNSVNEDTNKDYKDSLNKTEDKKAFLYLLMDAEPADNDWASVYYEEVFDNRPNLWYNGEGNWFELEIASLIFPFKSIPLNHPDGFKNDKYKKYNYVLDEDNAATFGYKRGSDRIHAARDLYYEVDEPICAVYDGVVKNVYEFYYDTWAIEIEHAYEYKSAKKLYVRYGEVSKNNILVKTGDKVIRGQEIAKIGMLYNSKKKKYIVQPYPDKRGMLHIEMYSGEKTGKLSNKDVKYSDMLYAKSTNYVIGRSFQRRADLFDPLELLKEGYKNSKNEGLIT